MRKGLTKLEGYRLTYKDQTGRVNNCFCISSEEAKTVSEDLIGKGFEIMGFHHEISFHKRRG